MLFLGTGAAEMAPNPLCGCDACRKAMLTPALSRKRSALLVNEEAMIDFGPDVLAAALQYGASLSTVRHCFVTHSHNDHLSFGNIDVFTMTERAQGDAVRFYLSNEAKEFVLSYIDATRHLKHVGYSMNKLMSEGKIEFVALEPYRDHAIGDMIVRAVRSNHAAHGEDEYALNYLIGLKDGVRLLYVADSGLYSRQNLDYLAGCDASVLVMEGTLGSMDCPREGSHLNIRHFIENMRNMREHGIINAQTRVYVTHINSKHDLTPGAYQRAMDGRAPQKAIVAYDGLVI